MAVLYTKHFAYFTDSSGNPLSGGKLYSYEAGTTTPKATYTTAAATVENANPVILDSAGTATIFIDGSYRFDLYDANDVLIESTDNVTNFTTTGAEEDSFFESFSGDGETLVFTLSEAQGTDEKVLLVATQFEYVVNGDFSEDANWTKGTGWSIGSGVATATGAISTDLEQTAGRTLVEGRSYKVTYTATRSAGSVTVELGGTAGTARSASGTYTETIIAGSTQNITFTTSGFTGTVDDVSVTEIAGIRPISTSDFTVSGTSLTFIDPPASGTNNILVWNYARLAGAASSSAANAATSAANAATSAATSLVGTGFQYGFDTDTTATDPGSGDVKFNNATLSSVTAIYISETTDQSQAIAEVLDTWDDSDSTVKGRITIFEQEDQTNFAIFDLTAAADSGSYRTLTVTYIDSGGSFTADDTLTVKFSRTGDKGATGSQGPTGNIGDISAQTTGTPATGDFLVWADIDDSNNTKKSTIGDTVRTTGVINGGTSGTITASDEILFGDVDDSNNVKKDTVQGILDLAGGGITLGTPQATTSGSDFTFSGIPSGTYAIDIMFQGISLSGTDVLTIQLGDSGGIETTGYVMSYTRLVEAGSVETAGTTSSFYIYSSGASNTCSGIIRLRLANSSTNTWVMDGVTKANTTTTTVSAGEKALSGELTQIKLDTNGTDTFDAGQINIQYS